MRCVSCALLRPALTAHRRAVARIRPAENYHQDYYKKKKERYSVYRRLSGRDAYIESVWGEQAAASHNVSM